jgi:hypothetical protein
MGTMNPIKSELPPVLNIFDLSFLPLARFELDLLMDLKTGTLPSAPSNGPRIQNAFNVELRNRYNILSMDINTALQAIKVKYDETSERIWMYIVQGQQKEAIHLSEETWD